MIISCDKFDKYDAGKIKVYDCEDESFFKDDMLILLNKNIKDLAIAYQIYTAYLKNRGRSLLF